MAPPPSPPSPPAPGLRLQPRQKYLALTLTGLQRAVAYRGATLLNLVATLVWVVVLYYLWRTVFAGQPRIGGFDWAAMRTYILVAYAINALLSFSSIMRMTTAIRTGEVATELVRPVDYLGLQLTQAIGAALIEGAAGGGLAVVVGILALHIAPPHSPLAGLLCLLSVGLGFLVKFLVSYLVALLCFWTLNAVGLIWAQTAVVNLLSGALVPLVFFPRWLHAVALATPFPAIVSTPVSIYLGKAQGVAAWQQLGVQGLWAVALWMAARWLWTRGVRAVDIQGG